MHYNQTLLSCNSFPLQFETHIKCTLGRWCN